MKHPENILRPEWVEVIRRNAALSENSRQLSREVLHLIYGNQWLKLLIPASLGGLEWPLPRVVAFFEALAWADGNVGWCVNLGAGANMFAGYLPESAAHGIFDASDTWCAGSGAVTGRAVKAPGGYIISGHWKYASGSAHATHFTANCLLYDENQRPVPEGETHMFRSFIFPAASVSVKDTWRVTGLCATSSNDFEVAHTFVPEPCVFSLTRPSAFAGGALYRFPFEVLAVVNMACIPLGITLHFIDLLYELMKHKKPLHSGALLYEDSQIRQLADTSAAAFYAARKEMYRLLEQAWELYQSGGQADERTLSRLINAARHASEKARQVFHDLFQVCGMDILYSGSALNKVWRDMAAAAQHYLLSPMWRSRVVV